MAGDAAATAQNLAVHGTLYRIGIANNVVTFALDVVLIWALYVLLKPVNQGLALLAVLFRMVETALALAAIAQAFSAMQFVTDAPAGPAFAPGPVQAVTAMHYGYASTFTVVAIFLGLGSTVFNVLLFRSRYIPRLLSAWGVFASLVLIASQFAVIVAPSVESTIIPAAFAPIVIDEIALGLWLLLVGAKIPQREHISGKP